MAITTEKELSDNARTLWLKAVTAMERRNFGYAVSLLQPVVKESPQFIDGRKLLRRAAIANTKGKKSFFSGFSAQALKGGQALKKDPASALEIAEKILENDPFNAQGNHLLKDAALALGFNEIAVFALQTISDGDSKDTKVLHELGELFYRLGDTEQAVAVYNKIISINPSDLIAVKRSKDAAASNTMKSGGWETAKDYRDLIKNQDEAVSLEQQGRVVKSDEVILQQLAELHQQVEKEPQSVDLARRIAGLYEQQGTLDTAIEWYNYASALTNGTDNWLLRKVADLGLKQIENGVKEREEWLALAGEEHEESARVRGELEGLVAQRNGLLLTDAQTRVERNPTDLVFRFELGEQLMNTGDFSAAIPELQKARRNPNVRLKAMNLLGQCYVGKSMLDLAVKTFTEAAAEINEMDATKKDILYKLGKVYEQQEQTEKALDCFKQIYEVDYGYLDVAKRVESSYGA